MSRCTLLLLCLFWNVASAGGFAAALPALPGAKASPQYGPIAPLADGFDAGTLNGWQLPLGTLGTTRVGVIGGVGEPDADSRSLASGLYWQTRALPGLRLRSQLLQSGFEGAGTDGSQLLMQTRATFDPFGMMPAFSAVFASARRQRGAQNPAQGDALRLSLNGALDGVAYQLRVAHSSSGFQPLGANFPAGQRLAEASLRYNPGSVFGVSNRVRVQRNADGGTDYSQTLRLTTTTARIPGGFRRLLLQANAGAERAAVGDATAQRLRVTLGGDHWLWRDWRLSGAVAWRGERGLAARTERQGYAWLLAGDRGFRVGEYSAAVYPRLVIQRLAVPAEQWRASAGIGLRLNRFARHLAVNLDYLAQGMAAASDEPGGLRVMLRYSVNAGSVLPALAGVLSAWGPGGEF